MRWNLETAGKDGEWEVLWRIRDAINGREIASGVEAVSGKKEVREVAAPGLTFWSDRDPALYEVEVVLQEKGEVLDVLRQPFGLRECRRDGTRLLLNGAPVYLRGTCDHHYFPLTCTAPMSVEEHRRNFLALKRIGFNWLRCHTWVPPCEYLRAADESGMLVQVEPPGGIGLDEWEEIVRACRAHPSVVLFCGGNEALLDEPRIEFLRQLASIQKVLSPDTLFSPMECLHGVDASDLGADGVQEPFPHNPRRLALIKEFADVLAPGVPETSYHSHRGRPEPIEARFRLFDRPALAHELCLHGNYLNLDLEHRYAGTRTGPDLFAATRRHLDEKGMLGKAALYYRNSCAHMRILRKQRL